MMTPEELDAVDWVGLCAPGEPCNHGVSPAEEAAIRADERLKTLRMVRNQVAKMNNDPAHDPYLFGYGARDILGYITRILKDARLAAAQTNLRKGS